MNTYDTIIIGSGVTGLSAGMYAGRLGLKTLIIGEAPGGTITLTNIVENYPGFKSITGVELAEKIKEHALEYKEFVEIKDSKATKVEKKGHEFIVHFGQESAKATTVIFATGTKWRELDVPGNVEFKNKGVHYCALCDGFFYRNKVTAVIGGGNSAVKDALVLAEHAKKVYLIHRDENVVAERINEVRLKENQKIEEVPDNEILEIKGDAKGVTSVILKDAFKGSKELKVDGLFVAIGHMALSELAKEIGVELDSHDQIKISRTGETNIQGIFAAGDVVDSKFKQAITGVGEGVNAAYSAYNYVNAKKIDKN
jgi:thioredoxin reductase (NADPH)